MDGIGSTPMPATQPHPLVMVGHTTPNKQRKHIMNENKPKVATWALCVDIDPDNPEMLDGLQHQPDGRHSGRQAMTDLLTPSELATMLGMSVRTLANWRSTGKGPPYLKIGVEPPEGHQDRRKVRYQRAVAERWATAHQYARTVAR